jgi:hypothetical protein
MLPRPVGQVAGNGLDIGWSVVGITVDSTDFSVAAAREGARRWRAEACPEPWLHGRDSFSRRDWARVGA